MTRDGQQKKAKQEAFQKLDAHTGFWLKNFCQKDLPVRFREGQREYFGKMGMSLHVDILFLKKEDQLIKHVYFTAMYRCDQSSKEVISLADTILDKIMLDEPELQTRYAKSDNAGCYQGNISAEAIFKLCQKKGIQLKSYDYNQPCCGKDQCDRESAAAKNIIRSYVDAGNDLLSAEDINKSLRYGYGMKNCEIVVGEIQIKDVVLEGPKIPNINNFHSFKFHENHMKMWRYYQIVEGKLEEYSIIKIKPAFKVLIPYIKIDSSIHRSESTKKKKGREDRQLCSLYFCSEVGYTESFECNAQLEEHLLSGSHIVTKEVKSIDKIRAVFVGHMKATTEHHQHVLQGLVENVTPSTGSLIMNTFKKRGLVLPIRNNFRYTAK